MSDYFVILEGNGISVASADNVLPIGGNKCVVTVSDRDIVVDTSMMISLERVIIATHLSLLDMNCPRKTISYDGKYVGSPDEVKGISGVEVQVKGVSGVGMNVFCGFGFGHELVINTMSSPEHKYFGHLYSNLTPDNTHGFEDLEGIEASSTPFGIVVYKPLEHSQKGSICPDGKPVREVHIIDYILDILTSYKDGLTEPDLIRLTGVPHNTLSPRLQELRKKGCIIADGKGESRMGKSRYRTNIIWKVKFNGGA